MSTCGTIALGAMVFTEYLEPLVPAVRGHRVPGAVVLALAFGLLLWRGIRIGDLSQQILSALKAAAFGLLIGVCLVAPLPPTGAIAPAALPGGMALITAAVLATQAVIYTYDGWNGPLYFGEEVKDGGRGIPRAMVIGVLLVMLIYVLLNVAFLRVLGLGRMAGEPFVAAAAGKALFGAQGDLVIRSLVLLSILSGINATCLMAPRVVFAMSRDRLLPRAVRDGERRRHADRGALGEHRRRRGFHRLRHLRHGPRPVRFLLRAPVHPVAGEPVRTPAQRAGRAEAVPRSGLPRHARAGAGGIARVPRGIGGDRLEQQLEIAGPPGDQLSDLPPGRCLDEAGGLTRGFSRCTMRGRTDAMRG